MRFLLVIMAKRLPQFRGRRRAETANRVFQPRAFRQQQCTKACFEDELLQQTGCQRYQQRAYTANDTILNQHFAWNTDRPRS